MIGSSSVPPRHICRDPTPVSAEDTAEVRRTQELCESFRAQLQEQELLASDHDGIQTRQVSAYRLIAKRIVDNDSLCMLRLDDPTEFKLPYRFGWKSADPKHYSVKLYTGSPGGEKVPSFTSSPTRPADTE